MMYAAQNHSIRKGGTALSYRMKMRKAEAVRFHREIIKVFRLCNSKEVRTPPSYAILTIIYKCVPKHTRMALYRRAMKRE